MPCKISINLFFIIFLLSKANFEIKDYTENIHKIPTQRNREKERLLENPTRETGERNSSRVLVAAFLPFFA